MRRILNFDNGRGVETESDIPRIGRIGIVQNMDSEQLIMTMTSSSGVNFVSELI